MSWPKSTESIFPQPLELGEVKNLWIMHLKVSNTATFKKLSFYQFSSSLLTYFLKSKTPSVIPLWRPFLMPMKGEGQKYHFQVIFDNFLNVKIDSQKVVAMRGP